MPRLQRQICDEGIYHIAQRGNNKNKIFLDEDDYKEFLSLLKRYKHKYLFELYHYCLMKNHIHLLVKIIKKKDMAKLFQGIFQSFQYHHRRKYNYCGSLYQNRYKSILIQTESYLLECGRYIERNPLRAQIVNSPGRYRWSSYLFYATGERNMVITPNPLYAELAKTIQKRRKLYIDYVSQARPYEELLDENMEKLR